MSDEEEETDSVISTTDFTECLNTINDITQRALLSLTLASHDEIKAVLEAFISDVKDQVDDLEIQIDSL